MLVKTQPSELFTGQMVGLANITTIRGGRSPACILSSTVRALAL